MVPLPNLNLNTNQTAGPSTASAALGGYGVTQGEGMVVNMGSSGGMGWMGWAALAAGAWFVARRAGWLK